MNETVKICFGLIGGLVLFLYGMNTMSDAPQKTVGECISAAGVGYSSCHAVHLLSISDISSRASMSEPATAGAGRNGKPAWGAGARRPS